MPRSEGSLPFGIPTSDELHNIHIRLDVKRLPEIFRTPASDQFETQSQSRFRGRNGIPQFVSPCPGRFEPRTSIGSRTPLVDRVQSASTGDATGIIGGVVQERADERLIPELLDVGGSFCLESLV